MREQPYSILHLQDTIVSTTTDQESSRETDHEIDIRKYPQPRYRRRRRPAAGRLGERRRGQGDDLGRTDGGVQGTVTGVRAPVRQLGADGLPPLDRVHR